MIVLCFTLTYILKQGLEGGWRKHYNYRCQPVDYTRNPIAMRVSIVQMYSELFSSSLNWKHLAVKRGTNWNWENWRIYWIEEDYIHTHKPEENKTRMSMLLRLSATICQTKIINQKKLSKLLSRSFLRFMCAPVFVFSVVVVVDLL